MTRDDFTESEWCRLLHSATYVAIAVVLTDRVDPVVFLRQIQIAANILIEDLWECKASSPFVYSLISSMEEIDAGEVLLADELLFAKACEILSCLQACGSADEGHMTALDHCRKVALILASKVPANQAQDYRMWLLSLGRKVAEAIQSPHHAESASHKAKFDVLAQLEKALREESLPDLQLT